MPKIATIAIPFPILRFLLPEDGEVMRYILKENKWKNESEPFFRHEMVEYAFGRKIRAERTDRKHEGWWQPGIIDKGDKITVQGGWRLHKEMKIISNNFFDGTFQAEVILAVEAGELVPKISKLDFEWNKSKGVKIIDFLTDGNVGEFIKGFERKLEKQLQEQINELLREKLRTLINEFVAKNEQVKKIKERSTLAVNGTTIVLAVRLD
jgi:hypothetical protein